MAVTLSIKKVYYDAILDGSKTIEYRKDSPFFKVRFDKPCNRLILHYFKDCRLECQVRLVELIPNPFPERAQFLDTDQVYAIHIGEVREIRTKTS